VQNADGGAMTAASRARATKIYVALQSRISTYSATANGNVAPAILISGNKTQLGHTDKLAVDSAGALWACAVSPGGSTGGTEDRWKPHAARQSPGTGFFVWRLRCS
jgi:hypothetical protein